MAESLLVGVLSAVIAALGLSVLGSFGTPETGAMAFVSGVAGSACMVLGQG